VNIIGPFIEGLAGVRVTSLPPLTCITIAPVFVLVCRAILHRDRTQMNSSFHFCKQNYSQFVVLLGGHSERSAFVLHEEQQKLVRYARKAL
jgi:hypothetical protein